MAYIVDQFNQPSVVESDPNSESNLVYMNIITESTAKRHHNLKNDLFYDEYVSPTVPLQKNENYYSHTKIKKINISKLLIFILLNMIIQMKEHSF